MDEMCLNIWNFAQIKLLFCYIQEFIKLFFCYIQEFIKIIIFYIQEFIVCIDGNALTPKIPCVFLQNHGISDIVGEIIFLKILKYEYLRK
jgi:hypothetical protein